MIIPAMFHEKTLKPIRIYNIIFPKADELERLI